MRLPVVAIVGRPNVGKSSLLNALAGRLVSIVQDMPGVTRDRISYPLAVPLSDKQGTEYRYVELLDTGGYGFIDDTGLTEHIKHQIELALSRADLVLFLVDCQAGLTVGDQEITNLLRGKGLKVALVANKADGEKADLSLGEFAKLGFGTPIGVSALNNRNLSGVQAAIRKNIDLKKAPKTIPEPEMLVAIVGKRNAGKSTLVNAIARTFEEGDEDRGDRVIVSEVPGTTRDSVDVRFEKDGQTMVVIDTAGVRKKRHMVGGKSDIEFYSFHRAERSIRRADVVLMLIDATEPVSDVDKKLASYVAGEYKPVVIVINKWDLAKQQFMEQANEAGVEFDDRAKMEEFKEYLDKILRHIDYAPLAFITAKEGKNVEQVINLARHLHKQASERISTSKLNAAVEQIFGERTPTHFTGKRPRVYYATQTSTNPPEIVLFVNNPSLIIETYQRFMINRFRELLPYAEVPIKLHVRGKAVGAAWAGAPEGQSKPVWDGAELEKNAPVKKTTALPGKRGKAYQGSRAPLAKAPKPGKSLKRSSGPKKDNGRKR